MEPNNDSDEMFREFCNEIHESLFHVMPTDMDDEFPGYRHDVIIVLKLLNNNPAALKRHPLIWYMKKFIYQD